MRGVLQNREQPRAGILGIDVDRVGTNGRERDFSSAESRATVDAEPAGLPPEESTLVLVGDGSFRARAVATGALVPEGAQSATEVRNFYDLEKLWSTDFATVGYNLYTSS